MNAGILVSLTTTYTYTALSYEKIPFDDEKYDPGDNFNTTTSEYTAPLTGYYLVTNHLFGSNNQAHQMIRVNDVEEVHDHMADPVEWGAVTEPTVILRLNAGDKLSVIPDFGGNGDVMGSPSLLETWLSVALLYAE